MSKEVILTGIRANNDLTIGNYFGAIMPIVDMALSAGDQYQINLFVPDLHSITTPVDTSQLQAAVMNNLRIFQAAGLPLNNPDIFVYRQSFISAHSELAWLLDCFTGMGELGRMTQYKEKSSIDAADDRVSVGLFNYPVLMAADILLYDASYVPVGEDQTQHLEFTRDIAERINNRFGEIFVVPKPVKEQHEFFGKDQGLRIKDLQDPSKKMSKSDEFGKGVIFLGDSPEEAAGKVMRAATDSVGAVNYNRENQPGITNLLQILALLTHQDQATVNQEWTGKSNYGELKNAVAEATKQFLENLQNKLGQVSEEDIKAKLEASETAMREKANQTLGKVQKAVGLR